MSGIAIASVCFAAGMGFSGYFYVLAMRNLAKARGLSKRAAEDLASAERVRAQAAHDLLEARNVHANCQRPQIITFSMPAATMPVVTGKRGVA